MRDISFEINENLIEDISEYSDSYFDMESSIEYSKSLLQEEMSLNPLSKCYFKDNHWILLNNNTLSQTHLYFDKVAESVKFNKSLNDSEFIIIVKCWIASLVQSYVSTTIKGFLTSLSSFLTLTKGLSSLEIDDISNDFNAISTSESVKSAIINSSLNLFDYYSDLDNNEEILSLLFELKKRVKHKSKARIIPPSKDILIFSKVVKDYFATAISEQEYFKYFAVWLWWNLTNIVPMRPGEFCDIPRDCLSESKGNYYIQLPRKKQPSKKIQVIDKVYVPEEIYNKVKLYKEKTQVFGDTKTLISYLSLPTESYHKNQKLDQHSFTNVIFAKILNNFYINIVLGRNTIVLNPRNSIETDLTSISQILRPGDTRHISLLNLKRQGYHPIEIARMAGHTSLQSQYHYFNHIENFVDLEILELITNSDLSGYSNKIQNGGIESLGMSFVNKYVLKPSKTDFKRKMEDGYCIDPLQRCLTEDCWECDYWRISMEEFNQKKHLLVQKNEACKSTLEEVIHNLQNLYQAIYANISDEYYSSDSIEVRKQLKNCSKYIENAIHKYVNLYKVKERIDFIGNQRQETKNITARRD